MRRRDFFKVAGVAGASLFLEGDRSPQAEQGAEVQNPEQFIQKAAVDLANFELAIDSLPDRIKDVNETLDKIEIPEKIESPEDLLYYINLVTKLVEVKQAEDEIFRKYDLGFLQMTADHLMQYSNFVKKNLDSHGVSDAEVASLTKWQNEQYKSKRERIEAKMKTAKEQKAQLGARFESIISRIEEK
jgi:hypothetical protein